MSQTWDRPEFISALIERFPDVASEIMDVSDGLLHCEMGDFARCSHVAISDGNFVHAQAHFEFVDEALSNACPALLNAIVVSYLENVFLGETAPNFLHARGMLSSALLQQLNELEQHWKNMAERSKGISNVH